MAQSVKEINVIINEVERSLSDLERFLQTSICDEVDVLPDFAKKRAFTALDSLNSALKNDNISLQDIRKGPVINVMDRLGPKLDDPAVQTALGTMAVQFSSIFRSVYQAISQKDLKKIESTLFKQMDAH